MKFKDKRTGAVYSPSVEQVARQMAKNPDLAAADQEARALAKEPNEEPGPEGAEGEGAE